MSVVRVRVVVGGRLRNVWWRRSRKSATTDTHLRQRRLSRSVGSGKLENFLIKSLSTDLSPVSLRSSGPFTNRNFDVCRLKRRAREPARSSCTSFDYVFGAPEGLLSVQRERDTGADRRCSCVRRPAYDYCEFNINIAKSRQYFLSVTRTRASVVS